MTLQQTISDEHIKLFSQKVNKKGHNECWEWLGSKAGNTGYGKVKIGGKTFRAHRVSWSLFFGDVPKGKMVLHKCNNPGCVNPYHLYIGDGHDNAKDRDKAGHTKGGRPPHKLSRSDVEKIHKLLAEGNLSQREISDIFRVKHSTISNVRTERCPHYAKRRT